MLRGIPSVISIHQGHPWRQPGDQANPRLHLSRPAPPQVAAERVAKRGEGSDPIYPWLTPEVGLSLSFLLGNSNWILLFGGTIDSPGFFSVQFHFLTR